MKGIRKSKKGYTIIEVLLAMGVFAVGFLAVAGMQIRAVNSTTSARTITAALEQAGARAEYIRALPFYPYFDDTSLSPKERFATVTQLEAGYKEMVTQDFTVTTRIVDNVPLDAVSNVYTKPPEPSEIAISKFVTITVFKTKNPDTPLAVLEMIRIWENDF